MSLTGEERKKVILEQVNTNGKVKADDLANQLQVSTETIRKYLIELEAQHKLKKVYGGAVKASLEKEELPFNLREISNISEKQKIGIEASKIVEDNDTIILDEGSTTFKMVEYIICKKNLTILTCSLPIVSILCDLQVKEMFDGNIVLIGGAVNARHVRVSGVVAEEFMNSFYASKAFISTEGVSIAGGVTSYDADKALLSKRLVQNAQYKYVLCDHTKLGVRTFYKICDIRELTGIICNDGPNEQWSEYIKNHNVSWISPKR
ncbi:MAG: DeoR/GlpR family DNA-binding transcription regulator [Oscillospiraceae bacterium]|jgi:DeoR/GlpR family transcriptional regulator of sugar metabolism|nr:DeoR/GlpR family DNA-binding transcription regulator [Oscillospiraceae bacterium]